MGNFFSEVLYGGLPLELHDALLSMSYLNAVVLVTGYIASRMERARSTEVPARLIPRKLSTAQLVLVKVAFMVPFMIIGVFAVGDVIVFVLQRGWLHNSTDTELQIIIIGITTSIATLVFAARRTSIATMAKEDTSKTDTPTAIYRFGYRLAVAVGWISGSVPLLFIALAALSGTLR